ncbi:MAG: DUF4157 domain-containing protein [Acidimicrobiales bacterium]
MSGSRQRGRPGQAGSEEHRSRRPVTPGPATADRAGGGEGETGPEPPPLLRLQQEAGNRSVRDLVEQAGPDPGRHLDPAVRQAMEASFGRSFEDVEVHQGPAVDEAARAMGAVAFAAGEDVYLHSRAPGPGTPAGREVLAEELAHVAQGVGAAGATELLSPGSSAEQEAHEAARHAAAGDTATTTPAPAAATGVGRFDILGAAKGIYEEVFGEEEEAAKADPTAPTPEQVAVITAGVVPQIDGALAKLAAPDVGPLEVMGDLSPVGDFLAGQQHPSVEGIVVSLRQSVVAAIATLGGSLNPQKAIATTAEQLRADAAVLEGVASAAKEPPAPTDGAAPATDALTPAQAAMLRDGPIAWLNGAAEELQGDAPDVDGAMGKIKGAGGALGAMAVPTALAPTFNQLRLYCDTYVARLQATKLSINDAVAVAASQLGAAKAIISAMSGAAVPGEPPPTGGA